MILTNDDVFNVDQLYGDNPRFLYGTGAPDVTKPMWGTRKKQGTVYIRQVANNHLQRWERVGFSAQNWDWRCVYGCILERVSVASFTDGGSTIGTLILANQFPIGAIPEIGQVSDVVGWAGDVAATLQIGDGTTVARYNTGTPSIFATASFINLGVPSGQRHHTAAASITLTVTSSTDFTLVKNNGAGRLTVALPYRI